MAKQDYYEVLEVPRDADAAALKAAFRKLARQFHPDFNPNNPEAEERFKAVNEAYSVLASSTARRSLDKRCYNCID
jgi:molecular chaperone DnaJ